ncbi:dihydroflavonol 4-reductase-like [Limulus polyphemus]|uniref:Dihydroflavonol 4-reductase-like n=1 Tax=Limulus polyphemus TaxID=6850 RepID=A0ABM1T5W4_LIMPO|nr:dihydroflavonol 4-reductase-like [Limulus polyphemus]
MATGADSPLVLVTGATGFVSSHVIKLLQEDGYKVRGTVRSLQNEEKLKPIKELCPDAPQKVELVEADLTKDEGWNDTIVSTIYSTGDTYHNARTGDTQTGITNNEQFKLND